MNNIHEKIRELRKQKGINQKQVADSAGLSVAAYSNIESGVSKSITIEAGRGIADALGVSFNELFEIEVPFDYAIEESKRDVEKLLQMLNNSSQRIEELEKRIEEKDIVINSLNLNRKFFLKTLVRYIEDDSRVNFYWIARQGYQYAKTEEQKKIVDEIIRREEENRKGMYDYFINEGLMTTDEIDQVHQSINDSYKKLNWENAFKAIFTPGSKIIPGKPIDFMG